MSRYYVGNCFSELKKICAYSDIVRSNQVNVQNKLKVNCYLKWKQHILDVKENSKKAQRIQEKHQLLENKKYFSAWRRIHSALNQVPISYLLSKFQRKNNKKNGL